MESLTSIVRAARAARGMTKSEFAAAVGLAPSTLASVEYGGRPSRLTIEKLAAYLQRPACELDPVGRATGRSGGRRATARSSSRRDLVKGDVLAQFAAIRSAFNLMHEQAVDAIRRRDIAFLAAARQRQAEILAQQTALLDACLSNLAAQPCDEPAATQVPDRARAGAGHDRPGGEVRSSPDVRSKGLKG
jgi:transcriptional regulator with XRE-family HTH domain